MSQTSLFEEPKPTAYFSPCTEHPRWVDDAQLLHEACDLDCTGRRYRYELYWPTGRGTGTALFTLANPSTATHLKADRTVTRCINFARDWGYAWAGIGNARAWRETDPDKVPPDPLAIGPDNDHHLRLMIARADVVVCGWGRLGTARGPAVLKLIREESKVPHALSLNADGSPEHPLYLSGRLRPFPMVAP